MITETLKTNHPPSLSSLVERDSEERGVESDEQWVVHCGSRKRQANRHGRDRRDGQRDGIQAKRRHPRRERWGQNMWTHGENDQQVDQGGGTE
jgi:hypothetical protein